MIPTLETARLVLQPLNWETLAEDAAQAQPLFAQWEIVQHLNNKVPWPYPEDGVLAYYRDLALPAMDRGEEWHWTLRLKSAPAQIVGSIGLHRGEINRGFWLAQPWHGQGLMTEAVLAVNDYWFNVLGHPTLRVSKAVANQTSRRISEKTGMRLVGAGESEYVSGRLPSETWEITAAEWKDWKDRNCRQPA